MIYSIPIPKNPKVSNKTLVHFFFMHVHRSAKTNVRYLNSGQLLSISSRYTLVNVYVDLAVLCILSVLHIPEVVDFGDNTV